MSAETFGLDNEDVKGGQVEKFTGEKSKKYRIGIVCDSIKTAFKGAQVHFKDKPFKCLSKDGNTEICCTHPYDGNVAKWKVGCAIVVYEMSQDGTKLLGYQVKPWIFNDRVYNQMKTMHKEFSLETHDLHVECTDTKYQSFTLAVKNDGLWRKNEKLMNKILAEANRVFKGLDRMLCKDLTVTEIRDLLGAGGGVGEDAAVDMDLGDVASSLDED